jgi:hypothetical protein
MEGILIPSLDAISNQFSELYVRKLFFIIFISYCHFIL